MKKGIIIVEDNKDVREGFQLLIDATKGFEVLACFDNCEDAIPAIIKFKPYVVLMDIDLPGISGIEGTKLIKARCPGINILVITVFENSERVFEALCAGASGYLTKNTKHQRLVDAIEEVIAGGAPMSTNIARMVVRSFEKTMNGNPLTEKENVVLGKLVEGKSYKSVASEMGIAIDTVKFHIKNIYLKLQVTSKEDAIALARQNKWV